MINDFEGNILGFDDVPDQDIKIHKNYYIHNAIISAQKTLMISVLKTSVNDGIIAYMVFIEHIEVLARAANYISSDYDNKINEYIETEEYKKIENKSIQMAKLSNKKLLYLMQEVFSRAPITDAMKDN